MKALGSLGIGELVKHAPQFLPLGLIGGPVASIIAHVFTHLGTEMTSHLSHDVIDRLTKNPRQLNHHLQKLFSHAIQQAVREGIVASYEAETGNKLQKELKNQLKSLAKQFDYGFDINGKTLRSRELIAFIDENNGEKEFQTLFEERVSHEYHPLIFFRTHEFPAGFSGYFEKNLLPVVRILFIEGLKSKEFEKARVAYEQMMAEETYNSLQDIKKDMADLRASGNLPASKYALIPQKEFNESLQRISSPQQLEPSFAEGLSNYLRNFDHKLDEVLALGKDTNFRVTRIDVKTDRIEKGVKKGLLLSYFLVIAAVASIAWAYFYFQDKTFNATIELRDSKNNALSQGTVAIEYGIKKERVTLNADGMATFTQIPSHFEQDSVEILLVDELGKNYALEPASSKILLKPGNIIHVRVQEKVADSSGSVQPGQKRNDPPVEQEPVLAKKEKPSIAPVTASSVLDGASNLTSAMNGTRYTQGTSEDKLSFSAISGSILSFQGKAGMYAIWGKIKMTGSHLKVIEGNVTGNLSLSDNNNLITGVLEINSSKAIRQIELTKD